jgi:hypothetical protein
MVDEERLARYWQNAEKCLALAESFNDPESKLALVVMANAWLLLTEQHVKNSKSVVTSAAPERSVRRKQG